MGFRCQKVFEMTRRYCLRFVPWPVAAVLALFVGLWSSPAGAQIAAGQPVDPASWAGQLENLVHWVEQHRGPQACTSHCYALERLRLTGSLDPGPVQFELEGSVLGSGPVEIPLFGPPDRMIAAGLRRATSAALIRCGTISLYTLSSRTRRAISCAY